MKAASTLAIVGALLLVAGCGPQVNRNQAFFVLIDTSGTYVKELYKAKFVVNYLLGTINPGDVLAVGRVNSRSFSEKEIVAKVSLGKDPLAANEQKRTFVEQFDAFAKAALHTKGSRYTDITGGIILAAEFLNETEAGHKTIVIFSDMEEELDPKSVRDIPMKLDGIRIVALNVIKLASDSADPRHYIERLALWEKRLRDAGASDWQVVNDMEYMDRAFRRNG
jgi:hypothetical protein